MENKRIFQRDKNTTISFQNADITIADFPFKIWIEGNTICIEKVGEEIEMLIHNDKIISVSDSAKIIRFEQGDSFCFQTGNITLYDKMIEVDFPEQEHTVRLLEKRPDNLPFEGFPVYKCSPRLIKKVPTEKIEISRPPEKRKKEKRSLVFSVYRYLKGKKEDEEKEAKRQEMYEKYLLSVRKRIHQAREKEIDAITYNYPDIQSIEKMVNEYSSRIYERNANDNDFLSVAVGTAKEPVSFPITLQHGEPEMEPDALEQEARSLKQKFSYIEDKPVAIDLKKAHLGLVGEKDVIHEQLKLLIAQLTFFHSYHELEIINIFHEKYDAEFKWMNWYPHLRIHSMNVFGCINNEKMRDRVLGSVYRILKERKQEQEEGRKVSRFTPHFLFVIDDPKLIADHAIMEYLDKEGDNLGFSIIYTTHMRANLPENIRTILQLENSGQGMLLMDGGEVVDKSIKLRRAKNVDFEWMARNLSVLIHEKGIVSKMPENITFFEMNHVERPEKQTERTDERVYVVNALGQGELLNRDLSTSVEKDRFSTETYIMNSKRAVRK